MYSNKVIGSAVAVAAIAGTAVLGIVTSTASSSPVAPTTQQTAQPVATAPATATPVVTPSPAAPAPVASSAPVVIKVAPKKVVVAPEPVVTPKPVVVAPAPQPTVGPQPPVVVPPAPKPSPTPTPVGFQGCNVLASNGVTYHLTENEAVVRAPASIYFCGDPGTNKTTNYADLNFGSDPVGTIKYVPYAS